MCISKWMQICFFAPLLTRAARQHMRHAGWSRYPLGFHSTTSLFTSLWMACLYGIPMKRRLISLWWKSAWWTMTAYSWHTVQYVIFTYSISARIFEFTLGSYGLLLIYLDILLGSVWIRICCTVPGNYNSIPLPSRHFWVNQWFSFIDPRVGYMIRSLDPRVPPKNTGIQILPMLPTPWTFFIYADGPWNVSPAWRSWWRGLDD